MVLSCVQMKAEIMRNPKWPYMSQYKLPNLSYKPPNVIGPFYLIAAVENKVYFRLGWVGLG